MTDEQGIALALEEARRALAHDDVPVGAVLARGERILASTHNERERLQDPTAHAEVLALRQGAQVEGRWYLDDCTLYVTAEPCLMCLGACALARVKRVVFGCRNPKGGAASLWPEKLRELGLTHEMEIAGRVREKECAALLSSFFAEKRGSTKPGD